VSNKEIRLGRGLESLIPSNILNESGNRLDTIPISKIKVNPFQPRTDFNEESIETLSESIKEHGLAQPIIVREKDGHYEIIAGERRLKACIKAEKTDIDVIIKDISDADSIKMALIENLEREDLNPIEIAQSYKRMLNEFDMSHDQIASVVKRKRSSVTNSLRLLKLPDSIQRFLKDKKISEGHAKILVGIPREEDQLALCDQIINERLNVRQTETKRKAPAPAKPKVKVIQDLEHQLQTRFKPATKINGTETKGKIVLSYSSPEELEQLSNLLLKA